MARGYRIKISDLARIIGVSESAVIAAQKILGYPRIGQTVSFMHGVRTDFVEEAWLAHKAEQAAARRAEQKNHRSCEVVGDGRETARSHSGPL